MAQIFLTASQVNDGPFWKMIFQSLFCADSFGFEKRKGSGEIPAVIYQGFNSLSPDLPVFFSIFFVSSIDRVPRCFFYGNSHRVIGTVLNEGCYFQKVRGGRFSVS